MGIKTSDKQVNYSHRLAQTKQVGQCIVGTLLVNEFRRLTMVQTWGKPPPPPYIIFYAQPWGMHQNVILSWDSQVGNLEILEIGTFATLDAHNVLCRPLIEVISETNLQPSSKALQWYVACHLHARKLGQIQTYSGRESK